MDPPTVRFRQALPYALFPASPPLAALHACRARALHPDLHPVACTRCGSLLPPQSRTLKHKQHTRVLRRECRICGAVAHTHGTPQHQPSPAARDDPSPPLPAPAAKPRPKKKPGLQQLLARNRQNEEQEHQKHNPNHNSPRLGGLAAFLSDLN